MTLRAALLGIPMALLLAAMPAAGQRLPALTNEWRVSVTPYIWGSGVNGDVSQPGHSASLEADFGDVVAAMEFAYMMQLEAWKGRFGILLDGVLLMTESDFATPRGALFSGGTSDMTTASLNALGMFRAYHGDVFALDLGAGFRAWRVESKISLNPGVLPGSSSSTTTSFVDPILGFRAHVALAERWILNVYADVGGFGVESDLTWQAAATIGYHVNERFTAHAGYRHLRLERSTGSLSLDIDMSGPIIGLTYRF
jgi:hypothetical protein